MDGDEGWRAQPDERGGSCGRRPGGLVVPHRLTAAAPPRRALPAAAACGVGQRLASGGGGTGAGVGGGRGAGQRAPEPARRGGRLGRSKALESLEEGSEAVGRFAGQFPKHLRRICCGVRGLLDVRFHGLRLLLPRPTRWDRKNLFKQPPGDVMRLRRLAPPRIHASIYHSVSPGVSPRRLTACFGVRYSRNGENSSSNATR